MNPNTDTSKIPEPPQHWHPGERNAHEQKTGLSWCRRCGRLLAADHNPEFKQTKPCQIVKIGLKTTHPTQKLTTVTQQ